MNLKCRLRAFILSIFLKIFFRGVIFTIIDKQSGVEKMYNLIWEVYALEKKYIDNNQFSKEILKDEFEKNSVKIGAFFKEDIIGTLRIIPPSQNGFYVEKDFNVDLSIFPREQILEISRLVTKLNFRNNLISFGLLREAFKISKKMKKKYWIVVIPERLKDHFARLLGIKFYPILEKPLTEKQLNYRTKMNQYYITNNPKPYLIMLEEI